MKCLQFGILGVPAPFRNFLQELPCFHFVSDRIDFGLIHQRGYLLALAETTAHRHRISLEILAAH